MKSMFLRLGAFVSALLVSATALATPYTCLEYNPINQSQCLNWMPGVLPGGSWCSAGTPPAAGYVNIFTAVNYGGWCETIPVGVSVSDASQVGWNNTTSSVVTNLHIYSAQIGSGAQLVTGGLVNFGGGKHSYTANTASISGIPASFAAAAFVQK